MRFDLPGFSVFLLSIVFSAQNQGVAFAPPFGGRVSAGDLVIVGVGAMSELVETFTVNFEENLVEAVAKVRQ